ncbi:MAG: TonB-dependent receptor, partial [Halioglobus sp.]|nr:TonB-dependent receptor [Halioglobus sp.]
GPDFFAAGATQSVPIFVDEVAASQPGAVFATMFDVARVELLRGPQGTLYGRNAPSGAYNITTIAPTFDRVKGFVQGAYSQWENNGEPTTDIRGAVNVPLVEDRLALRLTGVYAETDGSIKMRSPLATERNTGGKEHRSVRARLLWQPAPASELHLHANYQQLEDFYGWQSYEGLVPATGGTNPVPAIFSDFNDRTDYGNFRSGSDTEVEDLALRYFWSGELTNFAAVAGYQEFVTDFVQNQAPNPTTEEGSVAVELTTRQYTLELRASDSGERLDYVAGLFFISRDNDADSFLDVGGAQVDNVVESETFAQSLFGNVTLHLSRAWDLGIGLRYDDNDEDLFSEVDVAGFPGLIDEDSDSSHLSWSVKLNHFFNDNTTGYLAIDNAYREGGLSSYMPAVLSIGEALGSDAIVDTAPLFFSTDEEVSTAFEIGLKGMLLDNRMRYSAAVFYQAFDDHIRMLPLPNSPDLDIIGALYTLVNGNVEEVVSQGVELDVTYLFAKAWTLDFRMAYFDATVEEWQDKFCSDSFGDPVGEALCPTDSSQDLTNLPKINANTQLNYSRALRGDWQFYSHLSWTWRPASDGEGVTQRYNDALNFFNLNLGVTDGNVIVSLWGKNLTDEIAAQLPNQAENGDPSQPPALNIPFTPGREIGLTVGYEF